MTKPWIRGLVVASVALNVFLAGAFASGAVWLRNARLPGYSLESAGGQLDATDRAAFRKALREVRQESRPEILDGQQARREAADLLLQPVLDKAALAAALERARNADMNVRARLEQRIVEFAAGTSPDNRQVLAEGLLRHAGRQAKAAVKKTP